MLGFQVQDKETKEPPKSPLPGPENTPKSPLEALGREDKAQSSEVQPDLGCSDGEFTLRTALHPGCPQHWGSTSLCHCTGKGCAALGSLGACGAPGKSSAWGREGKAGLDHPVWESPWNCAALNISPEDID